MSKTSKIQVQPDNEGCYHRVAYVTVSIPVGLVSETPLDDKAFWRTAALEEFLSHPAINGAWQDAGTVENLRGYAAEIRFEEQDPES